MTQFCFENNTKLLFLWQNQHTWHIKSRTFLESFPKKAEHFWNQFRKKPNIFGKSPLNRSVEASNRCTRKFRLGRNIRIPAKVMPTNRSNDNHPPIHNTATIRRTRLPHRNNPLTPKYFFRISTSCNNAKNSPAGSKICDSHAGEFLGVLCVLAVALPWHSELRGFTSW